MNRYDDSDEPRGFSDMMRENPLPVALLGLGIGWLMINGMRGGMRQEERGPARSLGYGAPPTAGYGAAAPEYESTEYAGYGAGVGAGEYGAEAGRGRFDEMRERAGHFTRDARERATHYGQRARERAQEVAASTRQRMSSLGQGMRHGAGNVAERSAQTFREHPLMLGSMALLVGAAIGASLPRTRGENRLMGHTREEVVGRARDVSADALERAKRVATRTVEAAREGGAKAFTEVKETAKHATQQAYDETREAARKEAERPDLTDTEPPGSIH